MAYADIQAPEELAKAMLTECQVWRGLVAYPSYQWAELAAELDSGTVDEGDAADRTVIAVLQEQWDDESYIPRPRAVLRQTEDDGWSRDSVSTFSSLLRIEATFEIATPADLTGSEALLDLRRKGAALLVDFLGLARQHGRLDIEQLTAEPAGLADMKQYAGQEPFGVLAWSLACRGTV